MKKGLAIYFSLLLVIGLTIIMSSCKKSNTSDYRELLGSWISTDFADTIEFTSDHDFYKMFSGVKDHFDYSLSSDSITVGYNGMLYILVKPSNHSYHLNGDKMTIDFRPQCYGFRPQETNFIRK
jgi:hypothetical protein